MNSVILDNEYYELSDMEIQKGDWIYNPYNNSIALAIGDTYWFSTGFYKITASTKKLKGIKTLSREMYIIKN